MKNSLTFGALSAVAGAVITLVLYLLGLHSDPARIATASWIQLAIGLPASIIIMIMGIRAKRTETPSNQAFGYGRAFATGLGIGFVSLALGVVFQVLYETVINTSFVECTIQANLANMASSGVSQAAIDRSEAMMRKFSTPTVRALFSVVGGSLIVTLIAAVTAPFATRKGVPIDEIV